MNKHRSILLGIVWFALSNVDASTFDFSCSPYSSYYHDVLRHQDLITSPEEPPVDYEHQLQLATNYLYKKKCNKNAMALYKILVIKPLSSYDSMSNSLAALSESIKNNNQNNIVIALAYLIYNTFGASTQNFYRLHHHIERHANLSYEDMFTRHIAEVSKKISSKLEKCLKEHPLSPELFKEVRLSLHAFDIVSEMNTALINRGKPPLHPFEQNALAIVKDQITLKLYNMKTSEDSLEAGNPTQKKRRVS